MAGELRRSPEVVDIVNETADRGRRPPQAKRESQRAGYGTGDPREANGKTERDRECDAPAPGNEVLVQRPEVALRENASMLREAPVIQRADRGSRCHEDEE